jgi:hypothetical protein
MHRHEMIMKNGYYFLLAGMLFGAIAGHFIKSDSVKNENALGKLYPREVGLRASQDMRIIVLLNSNDVVMAKKILLQDVDVSVTSLSMLNREVGLAQFDKKVLQDASQFLSAEKVAK